MSYGLAGVQALAAAKIQAVPGVGKVYTYGRLVVHEADILPAMVTDGKLNYWCCTQAQAQPQTIDRKPGRWAITTYNLDVHAFYALSDAGASEQDFVGLVCAVIADFETGDKKFNLPEGSDVIEAGPLQWRDADARMIVNVLCHHARLALTVTEQTEG